MHIASFITVNASVAQITIAWAIAKGTLPLIGAAKVHHVLDAANASDIRLRDEEISLLEQLAAENRVDTRGAWEKPMV
jgi:diketogulonate reductase-like aldo/keto reductase